MDTKLLEKIIDEQIPCFFISPHLDDAVLSCGDLLSYLSKKTRVSVVSVFTEASEHPYTLSARAYLDQCHSKDAFRLMAARRKEDRRVLEEAGIEAIHFSYPDALWRRARHMGLFRKIIGEKIFPEILHAYPTYRLHIQTGKISSHDRILMGRLEKKLRALVGEGKPYALFGPLALGNHVDHVIVREVLLEHFKEETIFWSDFPYCLEYPTKDFENTFKMLFERNEERVKKEKMIAGYASQVQALFPKGIELVPEVYWKPKEDFQEPSKTLTKERKSDKKYTFAPTQS